MIGHASETEGLPSAGSGTTTALYAIGTVSTVAGPVVRPVSPHPHEDETDPKLLAWLESHEARQFEGHWVALDPETAEFLGLADTREELRRWRDRDISLVFVEPRRRR